MNSRHFLFSLTYIQIQQSNYVWEAKDKVRIGKAERDWWHKRVSNNASNRWRPEFSRIGKAERVWWHKRVSNNASNRWRPEFLLCAHFLASCLLALLDRFLYGADDLHRISRIYLTRKQWIIWMGFLETRKDGEKIHSRPKLQCTAESLVRSHDKFCQSAILE